MGHVTKSLYDDSSDKTIRKRFTLKTSFNKQAAQDSVIINLPLQLWHLHAHC